jgi:hypothetical protein
MMPMLSYPGGTMFSASMFTPGVMMPMFRSPVLAIATVVIARMVRRGMACRRELNRVCTTAPSAPCFRSGRDAKSDDSY